MDMCKPSAQVWALAILTWSPQLHPLEYLSAVVWKQAPAVGLSSTLSRVVAKLKGLGGLRCPPIPGLHIRQAGYPMRHAEPGR